MNIIMMLILAIVAFIVYLAAGWPSAVGVILGYAAASFIEYLVIRKKT